ncbi:Cut8 six-helix bundle-domain-containing protein [Podospora fimiseda]|uniref:Tethering factor for nuclear proteasome STS1 n=1 Tax=Podospora fimiseda TaxID=252190 RepID=A0AAN7BUD5_9PEZI|nr:Cut8 six-helix bundle-domain-containing protein [Podospora fimiseda]
MNAILPPQPPIFPHQHDTARLSPSRSMSPYNNMATSNRKRKADDDNDEMSLSPLSSPAILSRQLSRPSKKIRQGTDLTGRPLSLPRLLETLDNSQLRTVLQTICERHPDIGHEVVTSAPRPSVATALDVLGDYREKLQAAVPFGQSSSDYTYFRVKQPLAAFVDAISDFTPQFLPPVEQQTNTSLQYLEGVTKLIHELPDWESQQYRHHKDNAYDEISKAWALVITEASKRGGGFVLHTGGWDQRLIKHNQQSGGKLEQAVSTLSTEVGWMGHNPIADSSASSSSGSDPNSILNQLMNGTYGSPVRVGPW